MRLKFLVPFRPASLRSLILTRAHTQAF